ncbi:hypothetical protein THAOC_17502 [Thalassiosira oceanica]|uniref:Uncharacterized protein n=1 Tax=Thalassiosira oceanica TaxID=159749 RepID=K0SAD1_THAOC|nr:hypothetical protein THAOC_17502 [Thalassiosira oceanica]|eukprot:EJK61924.1 hypothetical protein THAOC_17502 [Thalassiosira oceanica]
MSEEGDDTEQDLLGGIATRRVVIDNLPIDLDASKRAPYEKKLGQLELKYQLAMEKTRLPLALTAFEEMHGALYSEPRPLLAGDKLAGQQAMTLAKRGVAWAQSDVSRFMIRGIKGFEKQEKAGLKWLNKSAAQDYPPALYELSRLHLNGLKSLVRKSQEKANELLLKSANLGFALANSTLAICYIKGAKGFEKNPDEAYFRASVAFALDGADGQAAEILGYLHCNEDIPEPSPYLACYYTNIAANGTSMDPRVTCTAKVAPAIDRTFARRPLSISRIQYVASCVLLVEEIARPRIPLRA